MHREGHTIDVYCAEAPEDDEIADLVAATACPACRVAAHDGRDPAVKRELRSLGLGRVPAVVVDEDCCAGRAVDPDLVREPIEPPPANRSAERASSSSK